MLRGGSQSLKNNRVGSFYYIKNKNMETMKIQVGFRCIADVKRIIPKPKGVRGKCKYMIRMEVGDAFYDDIKTCSAYRRLKSYMKQLGNSHEYGVGKVSVENDGMPEWRTLVWRKS
jgi:hypothetical protein